MTEKQQQIEKTFIEFIKKNDFHGLLGCDYLFEFLTQEFKEFKTKPCAIYNFISQKHNCSYSSAERCIRYFKEMVFSEKHIFNVCKDEQFMEVFSYYIKSNSVPKNKEFISLLYHYLCL